MSEHEDFFDVQIDIEDRVEGSDYPVIQWMNGDPKLAKLGGPSYTGGFFIGADQNVEDLPEGFEPFEFITQKDEKVPGYACRGLTFAPILRRACWVVRPETGLSRRFGWNSFEEASALGDPRSLTHVLADVGLDEPFVLSFAGMVAAQMTSRGQRGILVRHSSSVVNAARRLARKAGKDAAFPNCMFTVTVGAERDAKDKPVFQQVGSDPERQSTVVYPQWIDEPSAALTREALAERFVGKERLKRNQEWFTAAQAWRAAWGDMALAQAAAALTSRPTAAGQLEDRGAAAAASGEDYGF
jgi:hypothetical protein